MCAVLTVSPRKRNSAATRAGLLKAATRRFADEGYDSVGLREIAADAGVDVALVFRYFGGKEELFAEVVSNCPDPSNLFQGDPSDFGDRIARKLLVDPKENKDFDSILIMLRSVSSPEASAIVQEQGERRFYAPFARWLGGRDADVRARLAGSIMFGVAVERLIAESFGLPPSKRDRLRQRLARTLQAAIAP